MDVQNALVLFSFFLNLFLTIVLFTTQKSKASIAFRVAAFSITMWCLAMVFYRHPPSFLEDKLIWAKLLYFFPTFIPTSYLLFAHSFPTGDIRSRFKNIVYIANAAMAIAVVIPNLVIKAVYQDPSVGGENIIEFGPLYYLYTAYISGFFILVFVELFKRYRASKGEVKDQMLTIFSGLLISSNIALVTNLTLPTFGYFELNWVGQVSTFVLVGTVLFSLIKHSLLQEVEERKDDLSYHFIHESKHPATIMKTNAFMIEELSEKLLEETEKGESTDTDEVRNLAKDISTYSTALTEDGLNKHLALIDKALAIAEVEDGKMRYELEEIDLSELVEVLHTDFIDRFDKKGLDLVYQKPEPTKVLADKSKLTFVISSLLDNALTFTKSGGARLVISSSHNKVQLKVVDSGTGIPRKHIDKVFTKFGKASNGKEMTSAETSTGLSLYLSKLYIEGMEGKIEFDSKEGQGSVFSFTLPKI